METKHGKSSRPNNSVSCARCVPKVGRGSCDHGRFPQTSCGPVSTLGWRYIGHCFPPWYQVKAVTARCGRWTASVVTDDEDVMSRRLIAAIVGILLPYVVAVGTIVMFSDKLGNHDFYASGQLQTWDDASSVAIWIAYALGLLACIPWFWGYWTHLMPRKSRWCVVCGAVLVVVPIAVVQFVAVGVVWFLFYIHFGGIFP